MNRETQKYTVGAIMFEGFELLDLYGPLEMISGVGDRVEIITLAKESGRVRSANQAFGYAERSFATAPELDILLMPGGVGTRPLILDQGFLQWLVDRSTDATYVTSICTGSLLLAAAGLLDGKRATSNKLAWEWTAKVGPKVSWEAQARWVEDGKFFTSAGVSAGMDMSLALIERIWGEERRESIRVRTEYEWHSDPTWDPFAKLAGIA